MAEGNTVYNPLGEDNLDGNDNSLFLKLWAGEVLATFQESNKLMPLHMTRTISTGKSAAFPAVGTAGVAWHEAGDDVLTDQDSASADYLQKVKVSEREIFVDDPLVSSVLISDIESVKNHWDSRRELTSSVGRALAKEADEHIAATILAAARTTTPTITGNPAGANIAMATTTGPNLVTAAFTAAEQLDENDVPSDDRYFLVRPSEYYLLAQETSLIDRDFGGANNGVYAEGTVLKVAGFAIVATNNMPTTDLSATADGGARNDPFGASGIGYNGDWTDGSSGQVQALAFHKSAVGTVKLMDLSVASEHILQRMSTLVLASYAMGHNVLRPESARSITTNA